MTKFQGTFISQKSLMSPGEDDKQRPLTSDAGKKGVFGPPWVLPNLRHVSRPSPMNKWVRDGIISEGTKERQ